MPKVSEEYVLNKKKMIADVAYELCLEKTVSTVTMQDIINRTGLSQGGIYRFYKDIDEIFAQMLVQIRDSVDITERVDVIFDMADELTISQVITLVFDVLAEFMTEELMGLEKIDFELSVLAMNSPERVEKILGNAKGVGHKEYIIMRTADYFKQKMQQGTLQMRISGMELLTYISSAYAGVQMNCIVNNCYKKGPMSGFYQPKMQMKTLGKTVIYLLGEE